MQVRIIAATVNMYSAKHNSSQDRSTSKTCPHTVAQELHACGT